MKTIISMAVLFACQNAQAAGPSQGPDAKRLYAARCSVCHGANGEGGSGVSFKGKMHHSSTKEIAHVIKAGIPGTAMPPATDLSDKQAAAIAAYVQQLHRSK